LSLESLQPFFDAGWITDVLRPVRGGKEADVFLCRGSSLAGGALLAAKVYRPRQNRGFSDDSVYWEGGMRQMSRRVRVAVDKRSAFGREVRFGAWMGREHEVLTRLHAAGAAVPRPFARSETGLLLEWLGDGQEEAPQLRRFRLGADAAEFAFEDLLGEVELFLANDLVHADLSEYNVLWAGRPVVIDFPQAVDPRFNRSARELLRRDLGNLVRHFARYGLYRDPDRLAGELWDRWLRAAL